MLTADTKIQASLCDYTRKHGSARVYATTGERLVANVELRPEGKVIVIRGYTADNRREGTWVHAW